MFKRQIGLSIFLIAVCAAHCVASSNSAWTWVSGQSTRGLRGVYGAKGVADANYAPGLRENAVSWKGTDGSLWLFGGYGLSAAGGGALNDLWRYNGTNWTWVSGADSPNQSGVYGTKGVADPNNVPGGRHSCVSWTDSGGNLWLFGGSYEANGLNVYLNDLWKFDGTNWTWVSGSNLTNQYGVYGTKGVAALTNVPGARLDSISWIDGNGNLWLFGGYGYAAIGYGGDLNDLWKFDGTNWTWVSGSDSTNPNGVYGTKGVPASGNVPGGRDGSVSWMDTGGNLWLFGGGNSSGPRNDLWKFDGTNWTWVSGSNTINQHGAYGTKGVAASGNVPGARRGPISWIDGNGNLWLSGGYGYDASSSYMASLNDLWKFDGANWTWVSGSNAIQQPGVYGTKGVADSSNVPGARQYSISWIDDSGDLLLFGGRGVTTGGEAGDLNDLWKFDGTNWTWVSGSNLNNPHSGVYGTKGVASSENVPGARGSCVSWADCNDNLWLFGGDGYAASGNASYLNDLWKFDGTNWTWVSGSNVTNQYGVYGTKGVAVPSNIPGARSGAVSWRDAGGNLWLFGGYGYDTSDDGYLNDLWKFDGVNWTWVSGSNARNQSGVYGSKGVAAPGNVPGARRDSISWIDGNGNLWLLGGYGYAATGNGALNDLWRFNGTNWTWVSGSNSTNQNGVYGTKGVAVSGNVPGARYGSVPWTDSSGNLWLFGGRTGSGFLNDLWRFDGANWTWVSGSNSVDQSGVYGTKGLVASGNVPGAREYPVSWIDPSGCFWLFGGRGYAVRRVGGDLNDLWRFDGANWTWVSGSNQISQYEGIYGTRGMAASENMPGVRKGSVSWIDGRGNLWLFGGGGDTVIVRGHIFSDLWRFGIPEQATDMTGNGVVDEFDLAMLASQWLSSPGEPSADLAPNPAGDGIVNFRDFAVLAGKWLDVF